MERTLNEQQGYTARQIAAVRRQEADSAAAMRKREEAFEAQVHMLITR